MKYYRFILQLLYLLIVNGVFAEGNRNLVVLLKSGTQISLPVSEQPKITFAGTVMRVGDGDYQIENVRKWMVGDPEELGVENVKAERTVQYSNGVLTVNSKADIHIYNAAGMEMPVSARADGDGRLRIDLSSWPQDVYLVKVGTETLKIRKP